MSNVVFNWSHPISSCQYYLMSDLQIHADITANTQLQFALEKIRQYFTTHMPQLHLPNPEVQVEFQV